MSSESGSTEEDVEASGRVIPIFCTADIPSQTLDLLLERDAVYHDWASYRLWIVTDYSDEALDAIDDPKSRPPMKAFSSPFKNMTIQQINKIFLEKFSAQRDFTAAVYFILDSRTLKDETLMVIETLPPEYLEEEDDEFDTLRADFYAGRQLATLSDVGCVTIAESKESAGEVCRRNQLQMEL